MAEPQSSTANESSSQIPPDPDAPPSPERIIEALLFVGGEPLTRERAAEIVRGMTPDQFQDAIETLNQEYTAQRRPYLIHARGGGWVLTLRSRYQSAYQRMFGSPREAQLSRAAVDVLALVAYRQPATRQEIDSLRGADSAAMLRQLVRRGLVALTKRDTEDGKVAVYETTAKFLEFFGLNDIEDLPHTVDVQQI